MAIAHDLRKVATPRGGRWHRRTVARLLDWLHLQVLASLAGWIEPGVVFSGVEIWARDRKWVKGAFDLQVPLHHAACL
jgi:hypothetical protein